jgi:hypothetical protein
MIEYRGNHRVTISFEDWTKEMTILASKLGKLPIPAGYTGDRTHEVGIDWLSNLPGGHQAIEALFDLSDTWQGCYQGYRRA